jgi:hypothetical protein
MPRVILNTRYPYNAEGIQLIPGENTVPDDEKFQKFLKSPGVAARLKSGKLVVDAKGKTAAEK